MRLRHIIYSNIVIYKAIKVKNNDHFDPKNCHFDAKNLNNLNIYPKLFLLNPFNLPNFIDLYELYKSPYRKVFRK